MKYFIFASLLIVINSVYAAGGSVGNGGGAWLCREPNLSIRWAKLVDTFEAEYEFGLNLTNLEEQQSNAYLHYVLQKVKKENMAFFFTLKKALVEIENKFKYVKLVELAIIDDALYRITPAQILCAGGIIKFEQVANYTDYGKVIVQKEIFDALNPRDQAALRIHEAIYYLNREVKKHKDSLQTRMFVGNLFSEDPTSDYKSSFEGFTEHYSCAACTSKIDKRGDQFHEGIARWGKQSAWSYINTKGEVIIPGPFLVASEFKNAMAWVSNDEKQDERGKSNWMLINTKGDVLLTVKSSNRPTHFSGGLATIEEYANDKNTLFHEIYRAVINRQGEIIYPFTLYGIDGVSIFVGDGMIAESSDKAKTCRYLSETGKELFKFENADCFAFENGIAMVRINGLFGAIDKKGNVVLDFKYKELDYLGYSSTNPNYFLASIDGESHTVLDFTGQALFAPIKARSIRMIGSTVILRAPKMVGSFYETYQILNLKGQSIANRFYSEVGRYGGNWDPKYPYIPVTFSTVKGSKSGYIDESGNEVVPLILDNANPGFFNSGFTAVNGGYIQFEDFNINNVY